MPCYGTARQFDILTNKARFKEMCQRYGIGVPSPFSWKEYVDKDNILLPYPVFVKPAQSRGSRAARVCHNSAELKKAVIDASQASFDSEAIVERFIGNGHPFLVVYFFVDGNAYVQQLSDAYFCDPAYGLSHVVSAYKSPSVRSKEYFEIGDTAFVAMLKDLGIQNGPVCMQGFITDNQIIYFDPGRRFPGGEYERAFKRATGIDFVKIMIEFALTGKVNMSEELSSTSYRVNGKEILRLQLSVRGGSVAFDEGFDEIQRMPEVEYVALYHKAGEKIENTGSTHQRYAQVLLLADTVDELRASVRKIYDTVHVIDDTGQEMLVSNLNPEILE